MFEAENPRDFERHLDKFWSGYAFKYNAKVDFPSHVHTHTKDLRPEQVTNSYPVSYHHNKAILQFKNFPTTIISLDIKKICFIQRAVKELFA